MVENQSSKQKELNKVFVKFKENNPDLNFLAITPTNLPINISLICEQ